MRVFRFCLLCVTLWGASVPALWAHEGHNAKRKRPKQTLVVSEAIAHKPSAIPDRIILTWKSDPATSQAVTWRTDATIHRAYAQIAPAEAGPLFVKKALTLEAITTPLTTDLGIAHYHSVNFVNLVPATKYAYRVGDGANWSEWNHFRTASAKPEPFSFIYFGDAQNEIKSLWSRIIREAYSDAPKARFMIHAGDLVNSARRDAEWGEWFLAGGWVNAMVPSVPVPGNHEYGRSKEMSGLTPNWRSQFTLPENAPAGLEETAYFLDFQGTRIVALNSNKEIEKQANWLERVLSDNPNRWTVITLHHPVFSSAKGRDNAEIRKAWKPIFDKYHVDIVLQGHDHTYARSNLNLGVKRQTPEVGTMYVVSVSGPKMYNVEKQPWMKRAAEDTQLYQIISIRGDSLRYEARTATGEIYDAFELRKQAGRINRLIERIPKNAPERLRPKAAEKKP